MKVHKSKKWQNGAKSSEHSVSGMPEHCKETEKFYFCGWQKLDSFQTSHNSYHKRTYMFVYSKILPSKYFKLQLPESLVSMTSSQDLWQL